MKKYFRNIKVYLYSKNFYHKLKAFFLSRISFFLRYYYKSNKIFKKNNDLTSINDKGYLYTAFGENFYKECMSEKKYVYA